MLFRVCVHCFDLLVVDQKVFWPMENIYDDDDDDGALETLENNGE